MSFVARAVLAFALVFPGMVRLMGGEPPEGENTTARNEANVRLSAQVEAWIKELDDDAFAVRNRAEQNLRNLPQVDSVIIDRLATAAESEQPEMRARSRAVLHHWGLHARLGPGADHHLGRVLKKFGMTDVLRRRTNDAVAWLQAWQAIKEGDASYNNGYGESETASLGFWAMELTDDDADELARNVARMPNISGIQIDSSYGPGEEFMSHVTPRAMTAFQYTDARWMTVNCRELSDDSLAAIGKMTALEDLELENGQITDAGLAHLANLTKLTRISLNGAPLTGSGLDHLKGCKDLTVLILGNTRHLDLDALEAISKFKKLEALNLSGTNVTGAELAQFNKLPLTALVVNRTDVDDNGLTSIAELQGLTYLGLGETAITDDGLASLAKHTKLEELDLEGTSITGRGLAHLQICKKLRVLNLRATKLNDKGLAQLAVFHQLRELDLRGTEISGTGFAHLRELKHLKELTLWGTKVNDEAMKSVAQIQSLSNLYLIDTEITDAALPALAKLKNLEILNLRGTKVTAAGVSDFKKQLPDCKIVGAPK